MTRVAVVGAGIAGLVAGRELAMRGYEVELFERWPDVGGQASAFEVAPGIWLDRYYHHLFESDRDMIALHEELAPGELEWHESTVGMWSRGRIWPFVSPRDLLSYGPLPPIDRVRLGLAVFALVGREDWEVMDDVTAMDWLRSRCGERVLRDVWLPLLLGKFGDDAAGIPLAWLWAKFRLRRRLRGRGAGRERLGYPKGSFRTIAVALADDVRRRGGSIHLDRAITGVTRDGDGYALACAGPGAYRVADAATDPARGARADAVLFTTPPPITARLAEWSHAYRESLTAWRFRTAVVQILELARPYSEVYWMNVADPAVPFLGLVEHTNLVPADRYPARYLYVSNYVAPDDPLARMDGEALLAHYTGALSRMSRGFVRDDVLRFWTFREAHAQPVPRVGNRHRIMPIATPRPGLFVANTTQIYPEDRGTNYSARLGSEAAETIAGRLPPG